MKVIVSLRGEDYTIEADRLTISSALQLLGLHPEVYHVVRDGELALPEASLSDGDHIRLIPVISGG